MRSALRLAGVLAMALGLLFLFGIIPLSSQAVVHEPPWNPAPIANAQLTLSLSAHCWVAQCISYGSFSPSPITGTTDSTGTLTVTQPVSFSNGAGQSYTASCGLVPSSFPPYVDITVNGVDFGVINPGTTTFYCPSGDVSTTSVGPYRLYNHTGSYVNVNFAPATTSSSSSSTSSSSVTSSETTTGAVTTTVGTSTSVTVSGSTCSAPTDCGFVNNGSGSIGFANFALGGILLVGGAFLFVRRRHS